MPWGCCAAGPAAGPSCWSPTSTRSSPPARTTTSRSRPIAFSRRPWATTRMGAAIVSLLPAVLEHLGIHLDSDLLLVGSTHSLGRGNHAGIRFFLDHLPQRVDCGICVEGMQLGRLNFFSIGTARADVTCTVRQLSEPSRSYGSESALVVLNHIINRILAIATPSRPYTVIRMGKMRAGVSYDVEPDQAELGLEIVSHSDEMIEQICGEINDITVEMIGPARRRRRVGRVLLDQGRRHSVRPSVGQKRGRGDAPTGHRARPGPQPLGTLRIDRPKHPGRDAGDYPGKTQQPPAARPRADRADSDRAWPN